MRKTIPVFLAAWFLGNLPPPACAVPIPPAGSTFVYPSPTSPAHCCANIVYTMAENGRCGLQVYNEAGGLVATLQETKSPGVQQSRVDTCPFAPGVYFYKVILSYDSGRREKLKTGKFTVKR